MTEESKYQKKVIDALQELGWYVIKLSSTNKNGIADLLALKTGQDPWFIEIKAAGGRLSSLQRFRKDEQEELGFRHTVTFAGDDFLLTLKP